MKRLAVADKHSAAVRTAAAVMLAVCILLVMGPGAPHRGGLRHSIGNDVGTEAGKDSGRANDCSNPSVSFMELHCSAVDTTTP